MENIFIIGRTDDPIVNQLKINLIELPTIYKDEEIHDLIESKFKELAIDKLVICLTKENLLLELKIAFHIRLTVTLWKKRLTPILFTSLDSLGTILNNAGVLGHILFTKGCRFEIFDREVIPKAMSHINPLRIDEYKLNFLDIIIVHPDEKIGRHSLANQWGAIRLATAANNTAFQSDKELVLAQKQLYFKFIIAKNDNYSSLSEDGLKVIGHASIGKPDQINAKDFKILLIDDEAEKGWASVLKRIFKTKIASQFQIINQKIKNFDSLSTEIKETIENGGFDLFLVDLRLNGNEEERVVNPSDFSGSDLLKNIKRINEGNQVIMFTASNKAWNMKSLLDLGADGYYIKESPEYNFPPSFSKENYKNFKNEVDRCFNLSFLKKIIKIQTNLEFSIALDYSSRSPLYRMFYDRTRAAFTISIELLKKSVSSDKYLNLTFLTYYQILEDYANEIDNFDYRSKSECYVAGTRIIDDSGLQLEWLLKYCPDYSNGDYFKKEIEAISDVKQIRSLAKVSFILAYKFMKDNTFLKKWGRINKLRNETATHGNANIFVTKDDLFEILEILQLFLG